MGSLWDSAWDVVATVTWAGLVIAGLAWVSDWRHGRAGLRDRRGRVRPAPALAIAFAVLFAASGTLTLVAG